MSDNDWKEPPAPKRPEAGTIRPKAPRPPHYETERQDERSATQPIASTGGTTMPERMLGMARTLTLTNVLILGLCALVALPTYFGYRIITDETFRREFFSRAEIIDSQVPCVVLRASGVGKPTRYTIGAAYALEGRLEKLIAIRSSGPLSDSEIVAVCQDAVATAARLKGSQP